MLERSGAGDLGQRDMDQGHPERGDPQSVTVDVSRNLARAAIGARQTIPNSRTHQPPSAAGMANTARQPPSTATIARDPPGRSTQLVSAVMVRRGSSGAGGPVVGDHVPLT